MLYKTDELKLYRYKLASIVKEKKIEEEKLFLTTDNFYRPKSNQILKTRYNYKSLSRDKYNNKNNIYKKNNNMLNCNKDENDNDKENSYNTTNLRKKYNYRKLPVRKKYEYFLRHT